MRPNFSVLSFILSLGLALLVLLAALVACGGSGGGSGADTHQQAGDVREDGRVAGDVADLHAGDGGDLKNGDHTGDQDQTPQPDVPPLEDAKDLSTDHSTNPDSDAHNVDGDSSDVDADMQADAPPPPSLVSLAVSPQDAVIPVGGAQQFKAEALYSDDTVTDVTAQASWSSGSAFVAQVSNAEGQRGLAKGVGEGQTSVEASFGQLKASAQIVVEPPKLVSLVVSPHEQTIYVGQKGLYQAAGIYNNGWEKELIAHLTWTSSDELIASVSSDTGLFGDATGLAEGTVQISAFDPESGVSASADLIVQQAPLTALQVEPIGVGFVQGTSVPLKAMATYFTGSPIDVTALATWSSDNTDVASFSTDPALAGKVYGSGIGSTVVHADYQGFSADANVQVWSATVTSIAIQPEGSFTLVEDQTKQLSVVASFNNGTTQDVSGSVTWTSSSASTASVSASGLVFAEWLGSAKIWANYNGFTDWADVSVVLKNGRYCEGDGECASGICDIPYYTAPGGFCCEQRCNNNGCNICGFNTGICGPIPNGEDDLGACGDYFCDGNGGCKTSCTAGAGNCSSDCKHGWCWEGKCLDPLPAGSACLGGCQCQSGTCAWYVFVMLCT